MIGESLGVLCENSTVLAIGSCVEKCVWNKSFYWTQPICLLRRDTIYKKWQLMGKASHEELKNCNILNKLILEI